MHWHFQNMKGNNRLPAIGRSEEILVFDVDEFLSVPDRLDVGLGD